MIPEPETAGACRNCGEPMRGPVCAYCGQKEAEPIEVRRVVGEFTDHLLGLDFRLVRTVRELLTGPGALIRGYLAGRRIRYTNPFKVLFLVATLYLGVVTLLDVQLSPDTRSQETATTVVAVINYLVYLFLAPTAWWMGILFRRPRYGWAERYVILCYLWTGYLLLATALAAVMAPFDRWYFLARTTTGLVYVIVGARQVYEVGWWTAVWKGVALFVGYFVATFLMMGLAIFLGHLLGARG